MSEEVSDHHQMPESWGACFSFDASRLNPTPRGPVRKLMRLWMETRYSMTTLMRLSQYAYVRSLSAGGLGRRWHAFLAAVLRRMNEVWNDFEHGANPRIAPGVVLHHRSVCITERTIIGAGVHIYRHVTFGEKDGGAPHIKPGAKIASHAVVIGPVVVGARAIVAPGAVVVTDVPDAKVAAGVPAKIIGDVTDANYAF